MTPDISKFNSCNVLVVGDLMLDEYLWGDVDRISPEAPVQIVAVKKEGMTLGGAGNVVNNLSALGARVSVVGVAGTGDNGRIMVDKFKESGVDTSGIVRVEGRLTTRKTRVIAANQHVLRIDRETTVKIPNETMESVLVKVRKKIKDSGIVLISDYGKGLLTRKVLSGIINCAKENGRAVFADPKGLDFSKYQGVTLLTPNKKEASLATKTEITDKDSLLGAGDQILGTCGMESLLITCGRDGMLLMEKGEEPFQIKAKARQVFDVSGAGDTVISVISLGVASGLPLKEAAKLANTAAGIVVGKVGTATVSQKELARAMEKEASLNHGVY